jgi:hypothetical protein
MLCTPLHCLLQLVTQELPGQGRGLVTNAAVRKGELLLAMPQQVIVTPTTAAAGDNQATMPACPHWCGHCSATTCAVRVRALLAC